MVGFQGESRVFIFDYGKEGDISDQEKEDRKEQCRNILLKLYVAPLLRIGKIASTFFSIIDNAMFACVLLLLFGTGVLDDTEDVIKHMIKKRPDSSEKVLFGSGVFDDADVGKQHIWEKIMEGDVQQGAMVVIVCCDLLHNIMHSSTRLWNLGRVDLPLVLSLYVLYAIMLEKTCSDHVYWYLVGLRFCAFYVTISCDYWIEVIIHNMLMKLKSGHDFILPFCCSNTLLGRLRYPCIRLSNEDKEALKHFKGTFCAWNWTQSTSRIVKEYHGNGKFQNLPSSTSHFFFYFGGGRAFVAVLVLSVLVFLLGAVSYTLAYVLMLLLRRFDWGIKEDSKLHQGHLFS
jgi:hypothetical protein